jgi:hypothetical protein
MEVAAPQQSRGRPSVASPPLCTLFFHTTDITSQVYRIAAMVSVTALFTIAATSLAVASPIADTNAVVEAMGKPKPMGIRFGRTKDCKKHATVRCAEMRSPSQAVRDAEVLCRRKFLRELHMSAATNHAPTPDPLLPVPIASITDSINA